MISHHSRRRSWTSLLVVAALTLPALSLCLCGGADGASMPGGPAATHCGDSAAGPRMTDAASCCCEGRQFAAERSGAPVAPRAIAVTVPLDDAIRSQAVALPPSRVSFASRSPSHTSPPTPTLRV